MITFLHGTLVESLPHQAIVDVRGVGYQVSIPMSTHDALGPTGSTVRILTHMHVREDAHTLYGFLTQEERDLFQLLIRHVSGVGPKVALSVLSGMCVADFKQAVVEGNVGRLAQTKGLGRKTAERIVLELKDKVGVAAAWEAATRAEGASALQTHMNDALLALISLEYKRPEAQRALTQLEKSGVLGPEANADDILRGALRLLN